MAKMKAVDDYVNKESGVIGCNDINYENFIKYMKNEKFGSSAQSCKLSFIKYKLIV